MSTAVPPSEQSIEAYVMENIADYTTHKGVWREHIAQLNQIVDKATREAVIAELKGIKNVGDGTLEYDDELIARRLYDRIKALEELSNKEVK